MPLLKHSINNSILKITLWDAETKNAFSPSMADELSQILDNHSFEGLVVTSEGSHFCSGGNLSFYKGLSERQQGLDYNQFITALLDRIDQLPVPTACYVQGPCYGGGVELVSCFDWIVAHPSALFGLWQRRVGLTFGWGGQPRLAARLGEGVLESWLLSASTWPAQKALQAQLVNQICLTAAGEKQVFGFVKRSLKLGSQNFAKIKQQRKQQEKAFAELWMAKDHQAALNRFQS